MSKVAKVKLKPGVEQHWGIPLHLRRQWYAVYLPPHRDAIFKEISDVASRPHFHFAWNRMGLAIRRAFQIAHAPILWIEDVQEVKPIPLKIISFNVSPAPTLYARCRMLELWKEATQKKKRAQILPDMSPQESLLEIANVRPQ